jgi:hypothetical protein
MQRVDLRPLFNTAGNIKPSSHATTIARLSKIPRMP